MPTEAPRSDPRVPARWSGAIGLGATIALVAGLCTALIGAVVLRKIIVGHPFGYYTNDPAATTGSSPFVGVLSHAGVLLVWGAATASLLAGGLVARARGWRAALPLVGLAVGAAILALDDLFMGHESVGEMLELHEDQIFGAYAVLALIFLWRYRAFFRRHEWPLLALAGGTLGGSLLLDQTASLVVDRSLNWLEDCLKLFGLAFLAAYLVRLSIRLIVDAYPVASGREADRERVRDEPQAAELVAVDSTGRGG